MMQTRHLRPEHLVGRRWRGLVRESSEAQAEGWSPERQRDDLRRAADELGMTPVEPLYYERVGSGEAEGASELAQALADGRAGQFDVLVVLATSRFARNRAEAVRMKAEFRKAGIVIYFVAQRLISGTYAGGLTEGIHEVIDEQENETRRFWIAGGQRQRQLSGLWLGIVPFGMRKVLADRPDGSRGWDGRIEPDPETAPVVRAIFDAAARGEGSRAIATDLNARGWRTARGYAWRRGAIDAVLTNPVYAGRLIRYRSKLAKHYYDHDDQDGRADLGSPFEAVVEPNLFDQVRAARTSRHPATGDQRRRVYPLSRVMRCRRCGRRMTGVKGARARYYRCSGRAVYHTCDAPSIRADAAEQAFAEWLGSYDLPPGWRQAIAQTSGQAAQSGERDRKVALEERQRRLLELYQWGHIEREEYLTQSMEIKVAMGAMAQPDMVGLSTVAEILADLGPAWAKAPPDTQATIPPLMLKSIEVVDGQIEAWVVHAGLRPLLELCVPREGSLLLSVPRYTVRFSA